MKTTVNSSDVQAIGEIFIAALAHQAWEKLARCFDDPVRFRSLIPGGLRTAEERVSAANYFRKWFGDADQLVHLSSQVQPMHDRLHLAYRFRAHEDQWYIVEQQAYCMIQNGHILQIDLLCSGFRPENIANQT